MPTNFNSALEFVLRHESGYYKDAREESNYGITRAFLDFIGWKDTPVRSLTPNHVHTIYKEQFWDKYRLYELHSQHVANKVMDMLVNMGIHSGTILVQAAANDFALGIKLDGKLGPVTRGALNYVTALADGENRLLESLRVKSKAHYERLVAANPALAKFSKGWRNRADA